MSRRPRSLFFASPAQDVACVCCLVRPYGCDPPDLFVEESVCVCVCVCGCTCVWSVCTVVGERTTSGLVIFSCCCASLRKGERAGRDRRRREGGEGGSAEYLFVRFRPAELLYIYIYLCVRLCVFRGGGGGIVKEMRPTLRRLGSWR